MDLSTTYLGLSLPHPLMPGASPLVDDLDMVRKLEDAGAGEYALGPDRYLEHIRRVKDAVSVPVIGSLNGITPDGWLDYARLIERAGADALELNVYRMATNPYESGAHVEQQLLDIVGRVADSIRIPIAVKLSPFFSSLAHLARELQEAGADGLVLFNRFFQPDLDPEMLIPTPRLKLSTPEDLALRTRWLAILSSQLHVSLAATGGVHSGEDAVKAVLAGANAVQMVSALLHHGPAHLAVVRRELSHWLDAREYDSLHAAQASARAFHAEDPQAAERAGYLRTLQLWRV
jgi:dihydroorotate dehydrogenase (fumarate)